mgnify:CR=1 FL=1
MSGVTSLIAERSQVTRLESSVRPAGLTLEGIIILAFSEVRILVSFVLARRTHPCTMAQYTSDLEVLFTRQARSNSFVMARTPETSWVTLVN